MLASRSKSNSAGSLFAVSKNESGGTPRSGIWQRTEVGGCQGWVTSPRFAQYRVWLGTRVSRFSSVAFHNTAFPRTPTHNNHLRTSHASVIDFRAIRSFVFRC